MIRRDDEESDGLNAATDGLIDPSIDPVSPAGGGRGGGGGTGGVAFTLYLEFLGGLIPLLKVFHSIRFSRLHHSHYFLGAIEF